MGMGRPSLLRYLFHWLVGHDWRRVGWRVYVCDCGGVREESR